MILQQAIVYLTCMHNCSWLSADRKCVINGSDGTVLEAEGRSHLTQVDTAADTLNI